MDENYEYLSEWNLQTMIDAFMMGAVMSLAGSGFRIMTTKRFDTGIANIATPTPNQPTCVADTKNDTRYEPFSPNEYLASKCVESPVSPAQYLQSYQFALAYKSVNFSKNFPF